jgi:hypothetical protein
VTSEVDGDGGSAAVGLEHHLEAAVEAVPLRRERQSCGQWKFKRVRRAPRQAPGRPEQRYPRYRVLPEPPNHGAEANVN